jgi:hypothetical protein
MPREGDRAPGGKFSRWPPPGTEPSIQAAPSLSSDVGPGCTGQARDETESAPVRFRRIDSVDYFLIRYRYAFDEIRFPTKFPAPPKNSLPARNNSLLVRVGNSLAKC